MNGVPQTSYDTVPYESGPFYSSHPDNLAAVAMLHGMQPPSTAGCRVLELGCAMGNNLIPMAETLPRSDFVGIDLSTRQIDQGQAVVQALGLHNIELKPLSLLDVDKRLGQFDYIICHGVYSWVPSVVQERILSICQHHLTPHGVAYVSYNTYPGWHLRGMVREMMQFRLRHQSEALVQIEEAKEFLGFLVESVASTRSVYAHALQEEAINLQKQTDWYLYHEHLGEVNTPLYFHQFVEHAAAYGMQYLGEAQMQHQAGNLALGVRQTLQGWSADRIEAEQYIDFLCQRTFRQTLLCRDHIALQGSPAAQAVMSMRALALVRPRSPQPDVKSEAPEPFQLASDITLTLNQPLTKAALVSLYHAWPWSLPFDTLLSAVETRLGACERHRLAETLLGLYTNQLIELHHHAPRFVLEPSPWPVASPLARLQASTSANVVNRRHRQVALSDFERCVLRHLDGTHDRANLVQILAQMVAEGQPTMEENQVDQPIDKALDTALRRLTGHAFLVS